MIRFAIRNPQSAILIVSVALCLCGQSPAQAAQDNAGASSGVSLRFSPSARAAAMGDAFTAIADGVAANYYNPAGLGWTRSREMSGSYQDIVLDIGQGSLGAALPLGPSSAWGVLAQYVDYGTTRRTVVAGAAGAYSGDFTGQDIAAGLSYGSRLGNWGYGGTAKIFTSQIDNVRATAFAVDLGLRWQGDAAPVSLGVSLRNLGTALQYDQENERLPIEFRAGAAWWALKDRMLVTTEVVKVVGENWSGHAGVEYTIAKLFSLRAGYDGSVEIDNGVTLGAGFRSSGLEVDYAWIPFGDVGNNHRIGVGYKF